MPDPRPAARGEPTREGMVARGPHGGTGPGRHPGLGSGRSLSDLLNRVVDCGAVVSGDVVIGLAGVDLIRVDLRLLLIGAQSAIEAGAGAELRPRPASHGDGADRTHDVIEGAVIRDETQANARDDTRADAGDEP